MTAAVASYNAHERFFGNDLSNFNNFKTVERKAKVVSIPAPKNSAPVLKKNESPRSLPVIRRKLPPAKSAAVQIPKLSAPPAQPAPIKYSKDLLLSLRANATTSVDFVQSLNMPPPVTPKPKGENREELSSSSSDGFSPSTSAQRSASKREKEEDDHRLAQRQKQLEYGKNTPGYLAYVAQVPRDQRSSTHPRTPEKSQKCSKRSWDGQVRKWRRQLHLFDPSGTNGSPLYEPESSDSEDSVNLSQSADAAASSPIRTNAVQLGASIHAILASSGSPHRAEPGDAI